jgi:galactonate dehydratase
LGISITSAETTGIEAAYNIARKNSTAVSGAVENFAIQELPDHEGISATERYTSTDKMEQKSFSQKDMVTWVPAVENGFALLPETPGIGISLVEDAEARFPFKRRSINTRLHEDGSIVDQ